MDVVSIECPNCGAKIERKPGEYFVTCKYCGGEVCFDEIKEEAQIGRLKSKLDVLEKKDKDEEAVRKSLQSWVKKRNITLGIMSFLQCFGFFLVGCSGEDPADDGLVGLGSMCILAAIGMLIAAPIVLGALYPDYNILSGQKDSTARIKMWLKLFGISLCICLVSAILAFVILSILGLVD